MFIQIMNRVMNEAIYHPLAGEIPRRAQAQGSASRPVAATCKTNRAPVRGGTATRGGDIPPTFRIYASAFNTAVHGG